MEKIWWFRPVKGLIKGILRHHCEDYITPENECQTSELYAQGIYHEPVLIENIGRRPNFLGKILMKITMISNNFFFLNFEANNFFQTNPGTNNFFLPETRNKQFFSCLDSRPPTVSNGPPLTTARSQCHMMSPTVRTI